jgi:hypothetical protein
MNKGIKYMVRVPDLFSIQEQKFGTKNKDMKQIPESQA